MLLDTAIKHLKLDSTLDVDRNDLCNRRVGPSQPTTAYSPAIGAKPGRTSFIRVQNRPSFVMSMKSTANRAAVDVDGQPGGPYPWIRLPFQALFVAWALWSTRAEARQPASPAHSTVPDRSRTPAAI